MHSILTAFFLSLAITGLIIKSRPYHEKFSADWDLEGPQKNHKLAVPRIGGIAIAFSFLVAILLRYHSSPDELYLLLLICAIPTFAIGLTEDLTKEISVRARLLATAISAFLFVYLTHVEISNFGLPLFNLLFYVPFFGTAVTIFAITGLANAYNIIDGFNGLASMVGIISLAALGYVGYIVSDITILILSLIMIAAILGFFIFNYPAGFIFLGDGGAYLIGFLIAALSILITYNNSSISPWFAILVNGYPSIETIFTIYRRRFHQNKSPGHPDSLHFHSLIYRRLLKPSKSKDDSWFSRNSKTAPFLWVFTSLGTIPAILWWDSTYKLLLSTILLSISYLWLYRHIVSFRIQKWKRLFHF